VIVQQPPSIVNHGTVLVPHPSVRLLDAAGNPVIGASVTAGLTAILGNGTVGGTLTAVTNSTGLATFGNLKISKSGIYTLKFTSGGVTSPATNQITVT
jgi:adhesin/invasin